MASENALAGVIREVESFLDSCQVGVPAWVVVESSTDDERGMQTWTSLGYDRVGGKFRVAIGYGGDAYDELTTKAWNDCSRQEKLLTAPKLPELLAAIHVEVQRAVTETKAVTTKLVNELKPVLKAGRLPK
jgi:hypothetical protein